MFTLWLKLIIGVSACTRLCGDIALDTLSLIYLTRWYLGDELAMRSIRSLSLRGSLEAKNSLKGEGGCIGKWDSRSVGYASHTSKLLKIDLFSWQMRHRAWGSSLGTH